MLLAILLMDQLRLLELWQPGVQHMGGVPVKVDHEVACILLGDGSFHVKELSVSMNDQSSMGSQVSWRNTVGEPKFGEQTNEHGYHDGDVEAGDHLHGFVDHHDQGTEK